MLLKYRGSVNCRCGDTLNILIINENILKFECAGNCGYEEFIETEDEDRDFIESMKRIVKEDPETYRILLRDFDDVLSESDRRFIGWVIEN
jgi:hypothetical protein